MNEDPQYTSEPYITVESGDLTIDAKELERFDEEFLQDAREALPKAKDPSSEAGNGKGDTQN